MSNPTLTKSRRAAGALAAYTIVKHGASDGEVALSVAATDAHCGVVGQLGAKATGDRVDIHMAGLVEVKLGGIVAAGDPITADGAGKGVKAQPAAGANARHIGFADTAGIAGDVINVLFAPGVIQG